MMIDVPALQCKNTRFPSEARKHCQKTLSQNILCSLKLPSGPPQIRFPANPAGLLYVFLSYNAPRGSLHSAPPKAFLMSYYNTVQLQVTCVWARKNRVEYEMDWRGARQNQIDKGEINDRWMYRRRWVDCELDPS